MNILVIKTGALGDVLRSSFIAQALKNKYRRYNPEIYWITSKLARSIFINNPYVDSIILSEKRDLIKNKLFDIVINLEESLEDCKFASSLKKKKLIGAFFKDGKIDYTEESRYWLDMSMISKFGKEKADDLKKKNEKTHRQILSEMIGVNYEKYEPFLRLNNIQRKMADNFLRRHNLSRRDLIIGINTGAADRWPKSLSVKKTAELIDKLTKKYNARILLFGGPEELKRNSEIMRITKSHVIDTGCGNDLIEFPAFISVCSLIITTDSLGLHVSLALKRKTISLIGPTSPTEIDMYGIGEKVVAKSPDICTYKTKSNCMEKIKVDEIIKNVDKIIREKVSILITAFKEPAIGKAIESALNQKTNYDYEVIVSAPDEETLNIARKYSDKKLKIFKDPGKGKSYALNMIFKNLKTDLLILTDGDVWINNEAIEEIVNLFRNPEIGCLTGRPVPAEDRKTKYGYWANFLFDSAHRWRKNSFDSSKFIECSGYLFAFRKNKIKEIPLDVAEDSVIPYFFWEKGYKIGYAENAKVFVRNPRNFKDWIKQKTRTSKAHETLGKYVDTTTTPRVKTFGNEAKGITWLFRYPKNLGEFFWTFQLAFSRLYMWYKVFLDTKLKGKNYGDAWERVDSAR